MGRKSFVRQEREATKPLVGILGCTLATTLMLWLLCRFDPPPQPLDCSCEYILTSRIGFAEALSCSLCLLIQLANQMACVVIKAYYVKGIEKLIKLN